jgi:MFS family permease
VYVVAGARGVSVCGDFLAATALVLVLQAHGASGLAVSGLLLAEILPLVVLAPLTGRLADRADSRTLLVVSGLAQALVCVMLAFTRQPVAVVCLVALLSVGLAVTQPTLSALVPEMVSREHLPRATAIGQTASSVGMLAGPALAGLLVGQFGARTPLLIDAASYLAIGLAGLLLSTRRRAGRVGAAPTTADAAPAGWRLTGDPMLRAMVVTVTATVAAVAAVNVVGVFFIRNTLHASTTLYGVLGASWTAGMLIGSWLLTRPAGRAGDDGVLVRWVLAVLAGCCVVILAGAAMPAAGWMIPLWIVGGVFNGGINVFSQVLLVRRVPNAVRGRAFATFIGAVQGGSMFGFLAGGVLLGYASPRSLLAASAIAGLLVVAGFVVPIGRAMRRERVTARSTAPRTLDTDSSDTVPVVG